MSIFPSILPSHHKSNTENEAEAEADAIELSDMYEPDSEDKNDENGGEKA